MKSIAITKITNKLIVSILLLIFLSPVLLAWFFYKHHFFSGNTTTQYGTLIQTSVPLAKLPLKNPKNVLYKNQFPDHSNDKNTLLGKWLLLYISGNDCDEKCKKNLYNMRQIRTATGKNMGRIQRAILTFQTPPAIDLIKLIGKEYPQTLILHSDRQQFEKTIHENIKQSFAIDPGTLYIIDPAGNIILIYQPDTNPSFIFKDLQHLLKISQVG